MPRDLPLLFSSRIVRLFAYGFLSVVLVLYLSAIGLDPRRIGTLLTLSLLGDVGVSLFLTTRADAFGRRRTLLAGAILMFAAAAVFASTRDFSLLLLAATIGVISPSGNEVGPFLAIEQAALAEAVKEGDRTSLFAWYNLSGSFATALGSLVAGALSAALISRGFTPAAGYRSAIFGYGILGVVIAMIVGRMSPAVDGVAAGALARRGAAEGGRSHTETAKADSTLFRVPKSRGIVFRLSGLFALDSFAGGLIVQSILAWWFYCRFGLSPALLGAIFFGANILAGVSALAAAWIARRIGLLNTMVFTHLPSNVLLLLVPFMPTLPLAITVLLLRFSISQMDVPTRQSYLIAVVDPTERTAAAGITGVARTCGAALAPILAVPLIGGAKDWIPFVAAGGLKIVYDLLLLRSFRNVT